MDIESDNYLERKKRQSPYSAIVLSVQRIVRWLIWLFTLTEEDRKAAGIYWSSDQRAG